MKKAKRILTLIIMIAVFLAGAVVADVLNINYFSNDENRVSVDQMKVDIIEISEMAALQYNYEDDFEYDGGSLKFLGKDVPFTDKSMTVFYKGIVKIGTDMEKADVSMNAAGNKVTISVPHSVVLSHEIDEDSFQVIDLDNGLFNRVKLEDDTEFRKEQKAAVEKKISEDGVFEEADNNLESQLIKYFEMAYPNVKVEVVFK